jgi:hypothetical protein
LLKSKKVNPPVEKSSLKIARATENRLRLSIEPGHNSPCKALTHSELFTEKQHTALGWNTVAGTKKRERPANRATAY